MLRPMRGRVPKGLFLAAVLSATAVCSPPPPAPRPPAPTPVEMDEPPPLPPPAYVIPLFKQFPGLAEKLPHVSLGAFPTPIDHAEALGARLGLAGLYVKRDDISGEKYGGNKVRKLEFDL